MSRLAFLGTPEAAVPSLRSLVSAGHEVALVVSRRDSRRSRRGDPEPSPVKLEALELGLEVTDDLDQVTGAGAELGVVVAYGRIIPERILDPLPMVNVHFSLLPRWRGAAPVERAILAGDATTGVCVMRLEAGLDTGPVLARAETEIQEDETATELRGRLAVVGADLLVDALSVGAENLGQGEPQEGEITYAAKIDPAELELHLEARPSSCLGLFESGGPGRRSEEAVSSSQERGLTRMPRIFGRRPSGDSFGTSVATGGGVLELLEVQPEGRKRVGAGEWLRGVRPAPGERLGS